MNRLQRYMFGQVAVAVTLSVGLFIFVFVVGDMLKQVIGELANGRMDWLTFFQLIGLLIPGSIPYALPIGLLTGILIVLGRMSAQNEIISMKAAGLSIWRIVSPIFLVALLGVVLSLFINFEYAPLANDAYKRILRGAARQNPASLIVPGEFSRFKGYVIYVDSRDQHLLRNVWAWQLNENGDKIERIVHAESAVFNFIDKSEKEGGGILEIRANDASIALFDRNDPENFTEAADLSRAQTIPIIIPLDDLLSGTGGYEKKIRYYTFSELMELRKTGWRVKEGASAKEQLADKVAVQLQIQSNLANAMGILSMAMLAIPLGIKTSRSETLVNVGLALALALTFYFLTVAPSWIKNPHYRPDILVWLPNFLFQGLAIWLLRKAAKN
ncbi:MAG: LptF/LptG family permease [Puniceicoccales bacterium]|jgi:lipopolysaccharide export system permease protein|nr:LptF/LptG family permease [Puniceicoccales bacterium]